MCTDWIFTFPQCEHKVFSREQCVAKRQEKVRASASWNCCGLWPRRERKVCEPREKQVRASRCCQACRRNEGRTWGAQRKVNDAEAKRQASDAAKKYYNSSEPRPRPESSNVYKQAVQIDPTDDFNQFIRAQPQAPRRIEKPKQDPFWDSRDKPLPPAPLNITKKHGSSRPQARVNTPALPPRVMTRTGAGQRARVVSPASVVVPSLSVTYDSEPLPDDDFLDMMHGYHR
ncbi:hypothetical protein B0H67DRAFT_36485 [Lasiosphaeris hirsuta]|uniref:Uncharacterized protein n=1 Tax=Lasiosphaeris hirsuta TaxID=260670 RepID=A0AA40E6X7_9PEZI|nr:hypothetical protein B0H67DRAFT_36485 [Lasiosphaeris hirsuta]